MVKQPLGMEILGYNKNMSTTAQKIAILTAALFAIITLTSLVYRILPELGYNFRVVKGQAAGPLNPAYRFLEVFR